MAAFISLINEISKLQHFKIFYCCQSQYSHNEKLNCTTQYIWIHFVILTEIGFQIDALSSSSNWLMASRPIGLIRWGRHRASISLKTFLRNCPRSFRSKLKFIVCKPFSPRNLNLQPTQRRK